MNKRLVKVPSQHIPLFNDLLKKGFTEVDHNQARSFGKFLKEAGIRDRVFIGHDRVNNLESLVALTGFKGRQIRGRRFELKY